MRGERRRPGERLRDGLGALGEPNFRRFFIGFTTSAIGSGMVPIALTFAVLQEGHGAAAVGQVLTAETVPMVVLLLAGGVVADRFPRKFSMIAADVVRLCSQGILAVLLLTGHPPLWVLMTTAAILGAGEAFFNPALSGLIPEMVEDRHLQQANALYGVAYSGAEVVGPAIAGVIVAAGGAGWAMGIDAASYGVSAICLAGLRIPAHTRTGSPSVLRELREGWRAFISRTWLWLVVAQSALFNAFSLAPLMVLGAVVAQQELGGAASWGAIEGAFGAGSVAGALLAGLLRTRRPMVIGLLAAVPVALPIALLAVPTAVWSIAVAAAVGGIGMAIFETLWETTLGRQIPREILSRVSAYNWFGATVFLPIGLAIAGPLASIFGIRTMLLVAAFWALSPLAVLASPSVWTISSSVAWNSAGANVDEEANNAPADTGHDE